MSYSDASGLHRRQAKVVEKLPGSCQEAASHGRMSGSDDSPHNLGLS